MMAAPTYRVSDTFTPTRGEHDGHEVGVMRLAAPAGDSGIVATVVCRTCWESWDVDDATLPAGHDQWVGEPPNRTRPPSERPVTVGLSEVSRNPGHVRVRVFVGRNHGARGNSGTLTLRTDEWDELRDVISQVPTGPNQPARRSAALELASRIDLLPALDSEAV